jgi:hypothetical protein
MKSRVSHFLSASSGEEKGLTELKFREIPDDNRTGNQKKIENPQRYGKNL